MKCCIKCFNDMHIKDTIEKYGIDGDCDFCSSKNTRVYNISTIPNKISDMIISLVQTYSISESPKAKLLKECLRDDWDIFTGGSEAIQTLTTALCNSDIDSDIFSQKVIIPQLLDQDYLNEFGIIKGNTWEEFSNSLKYSNRFHNDIFNTDVFATFLSMMTKNYKAGTTFFRARIANNKEGFQKEEMGSPPKEKRCAGRVNPYGIGVLYLSSDDKTVLNETRVNAYDYVSIGEFQAKKTINVINLSSITKGSPFLYNGDIEQFAINRKFFQEIAFEIAKPLRRNDVSSLEYLPTQYISEFIKSQKRYDGVEFESTLHKGGYNLAIFDESLFECIGVKTVEVSEIEYHAK